MDESKAEIMKTVRQLMADESPSRAAEMLPGRVVNILISRELQETRSWPTADGRKTFHTPIPHVLYNFVRGIISELGVVVDLSLDKRIKVPQDFLS